MEYDFDVCAIALGKIFAFKSALGRTLIEFFGGPREVFKAGGKALSEAMPTERALIEQITESDILSQAEDELEWTREYGIRTVYVDSADFPYRLRECEDPPIVLFVKGDADLSAERMIAVVGTRRASYYGKTTCEKIVKGLADNPVKPTVVSGLAYGIDGTAHRAALEAGLPTIAVLPGGLNEIVPHGHRDLAKEILDHGGAIVTDFTRAVEYSPIQFLRRNRIIAGLSDATLLVESFKKGGGLLTTNLANSYGREVFAVPGRATDPGSEGCNLQIEMNLAHLATDHHSIERGMGWEPPVTRRRRGVQMALDFGDDWLGSAAMRLLAEKSPLSFNQLLSSAQEALNREISAAELSTKLTALEIEGKIVSLPGDRYSPGFSTFV